METEKVHEILEKAFPGALIQVHDLNGQGDHFDIRLMSESFRDKKLIDQHQMVYQALGDLLQGPIHAVQLTTAAPD